MQIKEGEIFQFRDQSILRIITLRERHTGYSVLFQLEHINSVPQRHWMLVEDFKIYYEDILKNPGQTTTI